MRNKKETTKIVEQIYKICSDYLAYIGTFGDESAYTDDMLRHIAEAAAKLSPQA